MGRSRSPAVAPQRHYVVLVLGDVGRSPRMQYHTVSLADMPGAPRCPAPLRSSARRRAALLRCCPYAAASLRCRASAGATVSLVGYNEGNSCVAALEEHPCITKCLINPPAGAKAMRKLPKSLFLLAAPFKVLQQLLQLFWVLCVVVPAPDAILVQNPPAIPALLVVWIVRALRGCCVVVDWHNLGYTVLAENSLGADHPVIPVARWYERVLGSRLDAHLCVTKSFKGWLEQEWGITAAVLYDKPPSFFRQTPLDIRHELFGRIGDEFADIEETVLGKRVGAGETLFTRSVGGKVALREDRPALLISSTSWTPDEDFGLLLDALVTLDADWSSGKGRHPHLLVVVTGKGPERAMYEARIAQMDLTYVHVKTMWLEMVDYPLLLGAADLGICLHTSTSNLDLPMKVVDMFGCGLPVCAVHFDCLKELVVHEHNGLVFRDSPELAKQCHGLLHQFPASTADLQRLARGVKDFQSVRWQDNWDQCARPVFAQAQRAPHRDLLTLALLLACVAAVVHLVVY